ncbi:hypothetical protein BDZ94DRAFT_300740 [Collybia nuda]|uniref:Uncharacterized protein n=1 Tax=Collybia nuda TaxID=64659 RepID=A0A9P6CKW0_9AGAR|nr:hypothetical protein BDZ94DRAFT_300740 [Collybia nuda]
MMSMSPTRTKNVPVRPVLPSADGLPPETRNSSCKMSGRRKWVYGAEFWIWTIGNASQYNEEAVCWSYGGSWKTTRCLV